MSEKKKNNVVLCMRTDTDRKPQTPTIIKPCFRCNHDVHVSQSSLDMIASHDEPFDLVCNVCIMKIADEAKKSGEGFEYAGLQPGQKEELEAAGLDPKNVPFIEHIFKQIMERRAEKMMRGET